MADETQEPEAPALTGNETAQDIKTDYSRSTSKNVTTYINRDHLIIIKLLEGLTGGGGAGGGVGRMVNGLNFANGRVSGAPANQGLFVRVPNATYVFGGGVSVIDEVAGFDSVPVPANMAAPGCFVYLSKTDSGGVEILPVNCLAPVGGKPPAGAPYELPCIGLLVTDADKVVSIDPLYTDELLTPNKLLILQRLLDKKVDSLAGVQTGGGDEGGTVSGASRADLLPWSADELDKDTVTKVNELIDALRLELTDLINNGKTKTMQTDQDHAVSFALTLYAAIAKIAPEVTHLSEASMVSVGYAGHSRSGDYDDPGVNGTDNDLLYTTMTVSTVERQLKPGA